ncbi:MAG: hypothetical protein M1819_002999 [Sarea resinae]|nr:MAG: hypothetical protein M1819_002999 [Sarea resinae]
MDSAASSQSSHLYSGDFEPSSSGSYLADIKSNQPSPNHQSLDESGIEREAPRHLTRTGGAGTQPAGSSSMAPTSQYPRPGTSGSSTTNLSGLVCNVHRTTGREPPSLVGASTTVLGDSLFVFGGRTLSRRRPPMTDDLYELDLIRRHWTKVDMRGDIPAARYFHSVCALGDTKLVCYGGMSPTDSPSGAQQQANSSDSQPPVEVMSDIHIFDVPTRTWTLIKAPGAPQGRYAHCATILPSSGVFASANAPHSAIHHNPASSNPNSGTLGVSLDGTGGAEMVVVGGQDSANHYIEQISVFNLRSLKWTSTSTLGRSCGAYRSVVAPLTGLDPSQIGGGRRSGRNGETPSESNSGEGGASMLVYSNYNFLDVKLELQVRHPDGSLTEKPMHGHISPPGLRFPNGGVIDDHFVVSGTYLTSSKQEYALWALDLRSLTWSRVDSGGTIFSQGSWNRGVLWSRRNMFVILGNRKRSLVEDYNHRRINFSNICLVELEAFGLYDNPRKCSPMSGYISTSSPGAAPSQRTGMDLHSGGRALSKAAEELGQLALGLRDISDMDLVALGGERVPVSSRLLGRRWGLYFVELLREEVASQEFNETATLRPNQPRNVSRNSSITITPSVGTNSSGGTTLHDNDNIKNLQSALDLSELQNLPPSKRPRALYLPHTLPTIQCLVHYLYTSSLPPPSSPLCTPQILCSLLQLARPYCIDGLLEATVEHLHKVLDERNAAAVFNAAAMAAGGGRNQSSTAAILLATANLSSSPPAPSARTQQDSAVALARKAQRNLRIDTGMANHKDPADKNGTGSGSATTSDNDHSGLSSASSTGGFFDGTTDTEDENGNPAVSSGRAARHREREIWTGQLSAVVGLQKRGLRGLMEGRRMRERGRSQGGGAAGAAAAANAAAVVERVGGGA